MTFKFCDSMINDYFSLGYVVFRGIVPDSLLRDLRVQADKARLLAREINGPLAQRIQPLGNFPDLLDLSPFQAYNELPELKEACNRLLGPGHTHGHLDITGLLVEPLNRPTNCGWHRDALVERPVAAQDDLFKARLNKFWHDPHCFNQINCPIYADSCTWFVPGSHLRQRDLPGEIASDGMQLQKEMQDLPVLDAEMALLRHSRAFPGAVQMHLGPGDFMMYRNLAWHLGNYVPYQPRATMHDVVLHEGDRSWLDGWALPSELPESQAA